MKYKKCKYKITSITIIFKCSNSNKFNKEIKMKRCSSNKLLNNNTKNIVKMLNKTHVE